MRKFYLIVNPVSGVKKGLNILHKIKPLFENSNTELNILETKFPGHAEKYMQSINYDGYEGVCGIGGDGTFFEMINGMLKRDDQDSIPMGLISAGTGNALMYDLDCLDPIKATNKILKGKIRPIDIIKVETDSESYFAFNVVGWGLAADAVKLAESFRWLGGIRYNLAVVIELIIGRQRISKLLLDGENREEDFILIIACNTVHTGKAMKVAPYAKIDDGKIDLVIVKKASKLKLLKLFPKLFNGEHVKSDLVEYLQVKNFSLRPKNRSQLNIDGELLGYAPFDVTMKPGLVKILN